MGTFSIKKKNDLLQNSLQKCQISLRKRLEVITKTKSTIWRKFRSVKRDVNVFI